jgi:hypothetical protein
MYEESSLEENAQKIATVVKKYRLGEQPSDFAYWQSQSYSVRLAALENIRREYISWKYGSEPGFQRVITIVKRQ